MALNTDHVFQYPTVRELVRAGYVWHAEPAGKQRGGTAKLSTVTAG
jgi:hypothetical protein